MNIYNKPYTYLIGWSHLNKFYYGVRYAQDCHPSDFWNKYFTSSKYVAECREEHGEPDIVQIRKTFDLREQARAWETKVLTRMKVAHREDFLNRRCSGMGGYLMTDEHRANQSKRMSALWKGKKKTPEHIEKVAASKRGKHMSTESKAKMSNSLKEYFKHNPSPFKGKSHSAETLAKVSQGCKNQRRVQCPHCPKTGIAGNMNRWHFDNCKSLKVL